MHEANETELVRAVTELLRQHAPALEHQAAIEATYTRFRLFMIPIVVEMRGVPTESLADFVSLKAGPDKDGPLKTRQERAVEICFQTVWDETEYRLNCAMIYRLAQISRATFEKWQRGQRVSPDTRAALARVLSMDSADLVTRLIEKNLLQPKKAHSDALR